MQSKGSTPGTASLLDEDFAEFPLGQLPHDYGPWGEYHYLSPTGYRGAWYEPTCLYSWSTGRWQVVEEDGQAWMEQCAFFEHGVAMLVTGEDDWDDYTLEALVRPLSLQHAAGVMVRYLDSRNHYLVRLADGGRAELACQTHAGLQVLAEVPFPYDADTAHCLRVQVGGARISAWVDDTSVGHVQNGEFERGRVGLWATAPARFARVRVYASAARRAALRAARRREQSVLETLRERLPKPKLWRVLNTVGFGCGRTLRLGDLDGDGRPEFVLVQHMRRHTGDNYAMISCLTALTLEGRVLWQYGRPSPAWEHAYDTCDLPCQVVDLDGDGRAEVVCCKDFWLTVLDGLTGEIRDRVRMPRATSGEEDVFERVCGDAIAIANLSGGPRPSDILVKNRYHQIWAYDRCLNPLWTHRCNTGHFCRPYDLDGDGCDELMIGYTLLDHDGSVLWEHDLGDHVDEIAIGHFDPARLDPQIAVVAGEAGFIIFDAGGEVLARDLIGHVQRLSVAKYRPDVEGLQYYVVTFWGNPGIIMLYDATGRRLHSFEPTSTGHVLNPVNWAGDGTEFALLNADVHHGGLVDGFRRRVVLFPDDGHPTACCESMDLVGDPRDELVVWDHQRIFIYTQDRPFEGERIYSPLRLPLWNASNYRAEVSLPGWRVQS